MKQPSQWKGARGIAVLVLAAVVRAGPVGATVSAGQDQRASIEDERKSWQAREAELLGRIDALERELTDVQVRAQEHEKEWMAWVHLIESFSLPSLPQPPSFLAHESAAGAAGESPAASAAEASSSPPEKPRSEQALADLRALLAAEQVLDLDFLEVGTVQGEAGKGFLGPVVVRMLDERLRPAGTLAAERLRLECSRTGWGVTLVLEEGCERSGGHSVPFGPSMTEGSDRGGVRRIHLPGVDPAPWIAAFPELLGSESSSRPGDDGLWDLLRVRQEINRLLAADARTGAWRLVALGGVLGTSLQAVHVVELDAQGSIVRRLFADHMRIRREESHVMLELTDGVQDRGGRRAPFLDGRYRIFLTGSDATEWEAARLPGLAASDRSPERAAQDAPSDRGETPAR
jgi:hypothetical protein